MKKAAPRTPHHALVPSVGGAAGVLRGVVLSDSTLLVLDERHTYPINEK